MQSSLLRDQECCMQKRSFQLCIAGESVSMATSKQYFSTRYWAGVFCASSWSSWSIISLQHIVHLSCLVKSRISKTKHRSHTLLCWIRIPQTWQLYQLYSKRNANSDEISTNRISKCFQLRERRVLFSIAIVILNPYTCIVSWWRLMWQHSLVLCF